MNLKNMKQKQRLNLINSKYFIKFDESLIKNIKLNLNKRTIERVKNSF